MDKVGQIDISTVITINTISSNPRDKVKHEEEVHLTIHLCEARNIFKLFTHPIIMDGFYIRKGINKETNKVGIKMVKESIVYDIVDPEFFFKALEIAYNQVVVAEQILISTLPSKYNLVYDTNEYMDEKDIPDEFEDEE